MLGIVIVGLETGWIYAYKAGWQVSTGFIVQSAVHAYESAKKQGCKRINIGIVEENKTLRKWYEQNGAVHTGTKKYDFFPFTCGYMVKEI